MSLKVVTIDFWNTLYDSSNSELRSTDRTRVITAQLERLGLEIASPKLRGAHKATWQKFDHIWMTECRTPDTREMVTYFWDYLEAPRDKQAIDSISDSFAEGILRYPPALLPDVVSILPELAQRFKLALISDTAFSPGKTLRKLMEQANIAQYFSAYSFSDETGVSKPDPEAFRTAISAFNVAADECIHIGDIERTDIVGAKKFGMSAILFTGDRNDAVQDAADAETVADARAASWREVHDIILSIRR